MEREKLDRSIAMRQIHQIFVFIELKNSLTKKNTVNSGCQAHMVIKPISTVKRIRKTCFLTLAVKHILL